MYFSSLAATCAIFLVAGGLNVANMLYYSSDSYRDQNSVLSVVNVLRYSAICTDREWVVCSEGCDENKRWWDSIFASEYYGTAQDGDGGDVVLINRTTCNPAEFPQGMINYGTLMLLIVLMSLYMYVLSKKEVRYDEANTTASDYTVVVHNPPPDAVDPDEWRDHFDQFASEGGGVTLVTVALNNEELLGKLVQRRRDIKTLRGRFAGKKDLDFDNIAQVDGAVEERMRYVRDEEERRGCVSRLCCGCLVTPVLRCLGFSLPEDVIWERVKKTTEEIRELQKKEYKAAAVYITFETEEGQRNALEAFNVR